MHRLSEVQFSKAIRDVNINGFSSIDLSDEFPTVSGEELYNLMNSRYEHPNRKTYYNEIAFYWPDDWIDVENGLLSFHDQKTVDEIKSIDIAVEVLNHVFGKDITNEIISFSSQVKTLISKSHHGLQNNELRLSRVILRQMSEKDITNHGAHELHEDMGYQSRPYRQLLSVITTPYGIPTMADRYIPKVGELLIFNAKDRRELLGLSKDYAFTHKGPISGPKLFFFFEFLGPNNWKKCNE